MVRMHAKGGSVPVSMLAMLPLYKMKPSEPRTLQSLISSVRCTCQDGIKFQLLIYDNTSRGQDAAELPPYCVYHVKGVNLGLVGAYNSALFKAEREGYEWL